MGNSVCSCSEKETFVVINANDSIKNLLASSALRLIVPSLCVAHIPSFRQL